MGTLNNKYQYGWYGTCEDECQSVLFDTLSARNYIDAVVRVALQDGRSFEKFTAYKPEGLNWAQNLPAGKTFDSYINPQFQTMECGMGYLVVRAHDYQTQQDPGSGEIEDFVIADFDGSEGFIAMDGCPQPTSTPTPIPGSLEIYDHFVDYSTVGPNEERNVTLKVSLAGVVDHWHYYVNGDLTEVPRVDGQLVTEVVFPLIPGQYTIEARAVTQGHVCPSEWTECSDSVSLEVIALTPTPTPVETPTPTPVETPTPTPEQTPTPTPEQTTTPTPTPTPLNCTCVPEDYTFVTTITNFAFHEAGLHNFLAFNVGDVVGLDITQLVESGMGDSLTLRLPNSTDDHIIQLSELAITSSGCTIYWKHEGLCYSGVASSNNSQTGGMYIVNMTYIPLPEGCEPTSTPTPNPDCCHDLDQSLNVVDGSQEAVVDDCSVTSFGVLKDGKLCWNTTTGIAGLPQTYNCQIEGISFNETGMQVKLTKNLNADATFRFETSEGVCYTTDLTNPNSEGRYILQTT